MRAVILAALLGAGCSGCWAGPVCQTKTACGLCYVGANPDGVGLTTWHRDAIQNAENRIVLEFAQVADPRFVTACEALDEWTVRNHPESYWTSMLGGEVAGQTWCHAGLVQTNNAPPALGSLAHELAHVVQGCEARGPVGDGEDSSHAGWGADGIYAALDRVLAWGESR